MRRLVTILAVGTLAAVAASPVAAGGTQGFLRLSWNSCDYVQNLNFTGPGQQAQMVVSLSGEDRPMRGSRVFISIGPNVQDAWRFDEVTAGCNTPGLLAFSNAALNKTCPQAVGGTPIPINQYLYDSGSGKALLDMAVAHDPITLDPATRYTLSRATFDHTYSVTGPGTPGSTCGGAEAPLCFHIINAEFLNDQFVKEPFSYSANEFWVTWQDAGNTLGCPGPTQAEQSTWGRVKGLYR
jgi:hypothetical protein